MLRSQMVLLLVLLLLSVLFRSPSVCDSVGDEGRVLLRFRDGVEVDPCGALSNWGDGSPCLWYGVECSDGGRVVALNLKDLCLEGTIAPDLGKLIHLKSLILNNNSFYGTIPGEIGDLQNLQVLDLGYNNLSGSLPSILGNLSSLETLILRGNRFINDILPEFDNLDLLAELHVGEELSISDRRSISRNTRIANSRKLVQVVSKGKDRHHKHGKHDRIAPASLPSPLPSPLPLKRRFPFPSIAPLMFDPRVIPSPPAASPQSATISSSPNNDITTPEPSPSPLNEPPFPISAFSGSKFFNKRNDSEPKLSPLGDPVGILPHTRRARWEIYISVAAGVSCLIAGSAIYIFCCRTNKLVSVMPWSTGLSGQLQKALVTGLPSLRRSELERACEDFSNVIGSLSDCLLYKGTLSSGVEIAVTSTTIMSAKDWSAHSESQFRKKISVLSKLNHKNFMNLLGYCVEEQPFTRMMVFEYAPNGTLFEHLHIREAEHLDWAMRLRIVMGIAYSLEHMHQLTPPVVLRDLHSSSIYLTDDYAAKVSDIEFWNDKAELETADGKLDPSGSPLPEPESVVYKFGIILLEIISGRRPFSKDDGLLVLWASCYLTGQRPLRDMVDPTLESFREEDVSALCEVILPCISPNSSERPTMAEVAGRLRKITQMTPDGATPKISPLWWAELEIISMEAS